MTPDAQPSELMALLDVQLERRTRTRVSGSVAADERHHQPWGIVHGWLYTSVIETFATLGAFEAVKERGRRSRQRHRLPPPAQAALPAPLNTPDHTPFCGAARMDTRTIGRWMKAIGPKLLTIGEI